MLSDPQPVAEIVRRVSPETLVVLDAVCAVASEDIKMDRWGIDVVVSASQKGLGAPPGLSVVLASQKAMKVKICFHAVPIRAALTAPVGLRDTLKTSYRVLCQLEEARPPHVHASHLCAAELTVSQMAPYHESIRRRIRSILCDPAGQPNPRVPRVLIPDNES